MLARTRGRSRACICHRADHYGAAIDRAMPSAIAEVKAAAAHGQPALQALVERLVSSVPANVTTSTMATTPAEYALGLALESYASTGSASTVNAAIATNQATAASAHCWFVGGHVGYRWTFTDAGFAVAWIEKDHNYWCGNNYSVTQNGLGFYHKQWEQFPYCLNVTSDVHSWDGPHASWAHGGIWASQGLWTPWGTCGTYQSGHAVVRIAANGHYDYYNDY